MYQLDLGYWRFSAVFPVHSEIGKRSQYSNRESSLLYLPMRRAFSDQGASRITRTAVSIYNLVSVFGVAVATALHPSAEKIRGSLPLFAPANIGPSHVSTNFLLHHLFRGLSISVNISATNASYLQLRGYAVKEGLLISKLIIVECLSEWRQFSKQFGGCWSMCSCFGKSGSPDG